MSNAPSTFLPTLSRQAEDAGRPRPIVKASTLAESGAPPTPAAGQSCDWQIVAEEAYRGQFEGN